MDSKTLRKRTYSNYIVILVVRDGVIKCIAKYGHFKGHVACTIKPNEMVRCLVNKSRVLMARLNNKRRS